MPNQPVPVVLRQGLDTLTHPVVAEQGTLIDCMNYEMTTASGYRRIDGFEAYDGWINGDIADYYQVTVQINDIGVIAALDPGVSLNSVNSEPFAPELVVGVVLAFEEQPGLTGILTYAPANKDAPVISDGTILDVNLGTTGRLTATANATKGSVTDDAATFVANIRTYSDLLRDELVHNTTPVAGMHFFRQQLVVARDCYVMTYTDEDNASRDMVQVGSIVAYLTTVYRVITRVESGSTMTLDLERLANQTNNASVRVLSEASTVLFTTSAVNVVVSTDGSEQAYLVALNTPATDTVRGRVTLARSVHIRFTGGLAVAEANFVAGAVIGIGTVSPDNTLGVVKHVELLSGTYAANTAAGWIEIVIDRGLSGANDYIQTTDDLMLAGVTKLADIAEIVWSTIPGTLALHDAGTRYQWITANFYGQSDTMEMYGATGASRGFWAQAYEAPLTNAPPPDVLAVDTLEYSWGNIHTDHTAVARDIPKYVAFHGHSLAFAIAGSVVRSVGGEPYDFNGVLGATETATGDDITGLLEAQDDTLIVFGRRSVRRLTGYTTSDISLRSIGGSGCFDYSAVMVGAQPIFTAPNGITALQQAEAYGDFSGQRISDPVANTLVPKLITDWTDSVPGGVAMALPVRSKNQYRLWLNTGEVYSVTFTNDGPKVMKSNYGFGDDVRVPFAWTSEMADSGKERVFVRWDDVLASTNVGVTGVIGTIPSDTIIYELDRGWGFNGLTFKHYFDIVHAFGDSQAIQIGQVRLHGWGYGLATLDLKSSGIEDDYDQDYHTAIQDISMPRNLELFTLAMRPVTSIVDQANWGLGVKLRINGTYAENLTTTEPSHICQVLVMQVNPTGAKDN